MLRRLRPLLWPAAGVLLVAFFLLGLARLHHPVYGFTTLLQFDDSNPAWLPEVRGRPTFINHYSGGYDGLYYAQLACRPLLRDPALAQAVENLPYRARRILASWVAWALAGGNPTRALDTYALINPLCWLALAGLLWAFFPLRSGHDFLAWAGLLFSAGALASVRLALTDLPALLLLAAAMLAVQRGRLNGAVGFLAAAGLTRETSLLSVPLLIRDSARSSLLRGIAVVAPLALWLIYVRLVVGPGISGWAGLNLPGIAWVEKGRSTLASLSQPGLAWLGWTTLLAFVALTVQAGWLLLRPQWGSAWWRFGVGYAGLLLLLGPAIWEGFPGAATRVLLPLNLAFNALAPRTRAGFALLVLGNLTVPAGLLEFTRLPNDGVELAAVRAEPATVLVQTHSGWFGVERDARNFWAWSGGEAELRVVSLPAGTTQDLSFQLRSLAPCTAEVTQAGRVLWRGSLGSAWRPVNLSCADGPLTFHSDRPPVRESSASDARDLAFCIAHVRISGVIPARK